MELVEPKVHIIGDSRLDEEGLKALLEEFGVEGWTTDAESDAEYISEVEGKLCYMSFDTSLNDNLTKTGTRNNFQYLQEGIIGTHHGSVLEHTTVNFVFTNVSRVCTHELVRHRAGAAYSQLSGRYVRKGELKFWLPSVIRDNVELAEIFDEALAYMEETQRRLVEKSRINGMTGREQFHTKKLLTSAFRRLIGEGVAGHIGATYNHRAIRHLIELRTSVGAEEEVRLVFNKVFDAVSNRYPALYADAHRTMVEGHYEITFEHSKV